MALLRRILVNMILPVVRLYWFLFRPKVKGVKCVIEYNDTILMVRHNYGKRRWTLPGGRIEKNETPSDAVRREVKEEVGIIVSEVRSLGEFLSTLDYKQDYIYCFCATTNNKDIKIDPNEIYEASWFPINKIPEDRTEIASKILRMYNPHNFSCNS